LQPSKQDSPTNSSEDGSNIAVNAQQPEKADLSIRTISESTGNGDLTSFRHRAKQEAPMVLIDGGIETASSEEQPSNGMSRRQSRCEPGSNKTDWSAEHQQKQSNPMPFTDAGILIVLRLEQDTNAIISIADNGEVVGMCNATRDLQKPKQ
jgi:hypothetical protein